MPIAIAMPRLAAAALGLALPAFAAAPAPVIASLAPAAAPGARLELVIQGSGFDAGGSAFEVRDAAGRLLAAGLLTHRSGSRLEGTVDLAGAKPGSYHVIVVNPGGERSKAATLLLRPEVTVTPLSGRPGTLFTYAGRGFTGGLDAITHLEGPTAVAFQSKRITTTPQGTFEQQIDSAEFRPGTFRVWAVDDRTGVAASPARFEIQTSNRSR